MTATPSPRTRGFLFADLRGYTEYVETHGDREAADLLAAYRSLVRTAVAAHEGAEIRTEGDSFYLVFPAVGEAVSCGLDIVEKRALHSTRLGRPVGRDADPRRDTAFHASPNTVAHAGARDGSCDRTDRCTDGRADRGFHVAVTFRSSGCTPPRRSCASASTRERFPIDSGVHREVA
jgi:class 3 adenylate cyclase